MRTPDAAYCVPAREKHAGGPRKQKKPRFGGAFRFRIRFQFPAWKSQELVPPSSGCVALPLMTPPSMGPPEKCTSMSQLPGTCSVYDSPSRVHVVVTVSGNVILRLHV